MPQAPHLKKKKNEIKNKAKIFFFLFRVRSSLKVEYCMIQY